MCGFVEIGMNGGGSAANGEVVLLSMKSFHPWTWKSGSEIAPASDSVVSPISLFLFPSFLSTPPYIFIPIPSSTLFHSLASTFSFFSTPSLTLFSSFCFFSLIFFSLFSFLLSFSSPFPSLSSLPLPRLIFAFAPMTPFSI